MKILLVNESVMKEQRFNYSVKLYPLILTRYYLKQAKSLHDSSLKLINFTRRKQNKQNGTRGHL
jgi:hypothetical protein